MHIKFCHKLQLDSYSPQLVKISNSLSLWKQVLLLNFLKAKCLDGPKEVLEILPLQDFDPWFLAPTKQFHCQHSAVLIINHY